MKMRIAVSCAAVLLSASTIWASTIVDVVADDALLGHDGSVDHTPSVLVSGNAGNNPTIAYNAIMFFELPSVTYSVGVTAADLSIRMRNHTFSTVPAGPTSADLWGLGWQSNTTVSSGWYNEADTDAGAGENITSRTKIQDDLLVRSLPEPSDVTLNASGQTALLSFLKSLYDNGAQGGDFAIIRLGPDYAPPTGSTTTTRRYLVESASNSTASYRPTLEMTIPEPGTLALAMAGGLLMVGRRRARVSC